MVRRGRPEDRDDARDASAHARRKDAPPPRAEPEPAIADVPESELEEDPAIVGAGALLAGLTPRAAVAVAIAGDPDSLAAGAILLAALARAGIAATPVFATRGELPGDASLEARIARAGTRLAVYAGGAPPLGAAHGRAALVLDRRAAPDRRPARAVVSRLAGREVATAALAFVVGSRLADLGDLRWLVGLGETAALGRPLTRSAASASSLAVAAALVGAAQRSAAYDLATALAAIRGAGGPDPIANLETPEAAALARMRTEVALELRRARKAPFERVGPVVFSGIKSPCAVQGLIAEAAAERRGGHAILVANLGYTSGQAFLALRGDVPPPQALAGLAPDARIAAGELEKILNSLG